MAFREVRMFEVREVLRLWVRGKGLRAIERLAGIDRKTVRRYVEAAADTGLDRDGGEDQLNDVFLSLVVEKVRPHRTDGDGPTWRNLEPGGASSLPSHKSVYALRDLKRLPSMAAEHGPPSAPMRRCSSTIRCRGRRCARSTRCSAW